MIRTTKISAVLLALLFAAGGAMAQSAGSSAGTSMKNTGDDNARPVESSVGSAPTNDGTAKMKSTKAKKAPKAKKSDDSMKSSNGGANSNPSAGNGPEAGNANR
jgi:hypothetical protein